MDLIIRNARLVDGEGYGSVDGLVDVGVERGRIAAIQPALAAEGRELDVGGRLLSPGFVETHIHLDKSRIIDRCAPEAGRQANTMKRVAEVKKSFTVEDVHERAAKTLENCLLHGTTHMRTHVEVDPGVGLRGFEGVLALVKEYAWAIDLEICVFPQEGLTDNPGTEELMVEALKGGASLVGAAPGYDSDHKGQIDRVFALAREFDVDIDMHLDFGNTPEHMDVDYVCKLTEQYHYGGRVAVGHETKMSTLPPEEFEATARRLADAGVAVTVLPATDLFLMGRHQEYNVVRGVTPAHKLLKLGVNCSLSSNNILNPFTPMGDCSLIRMANLYANVCQVADGEDMRGCFDMLTGRSARLLRLENYGIAVGNPADMVVLDCEGPEQAVAELAVPLYGFKGGRQTFTRAPAQLHAPD